MPKLRDKIPGGKANNQNLNQYCPKQLLMGILVEMEHTDDIATAVEITTDHLEENRKYYSYLEDMESKMEKSVKSNRNHLRAQNSTLVDKAIRNTKYYTNSWDDNEKEDEEEEVSIFKTNNKLFANLQESAWQRIANSIGIKIAQDSSEEDILQVIDDLLQETEDSNMRSKLQLMRSYFNNPENLKAAKRAAEGPITEEGGVYTQDPVPVFTIKPEYLEYWGNVPADTQVTDDMVQELSRTWQVSVEDLYNQLQPAQAAQPVTARRRNQMKRRGEYQGWSNYETWAIALILDNDRGTYEMMQEMREEAESYAKDGGSPALSTALVFSDMLKSFVEEIVEDDLGKVSDFSSQLIHGAIGEVNWREIAENELEK